MNSDNILNMNSGYKVLISSIRTKIHYFNIIYIIINTNNFIYENINIFII